MSDEDGFNMEVLEAVERARQQKREEVAKVEADFYEAIRQRDEARAKLADALHVLTAVVRAVWPEGHGMTRSPPSEEARHLLDAAARLGVKP